jgi:hypothetical protein
MNFLLKGNPHLADLLDVLANLSMKALKSTSGDIHDFLCFVDADGVGSMFATASILQHFDQMIAGMSERLLPNTGIPWNLSTVMDAYYGCGTGSFVAATLALGFPMTESVLSDIRAFRWKRLFPSCSTGCLSCTRAAVDIGTSAHSAYYGKKATPDEDVFRGKPCDCDAYEASSATGLEKRIAIASPDDLETSLALVASQLQDNIFQSVIQAIKAKYSDALAFYRKWNFAETMSMIHNFLTTYETATSNSTMKDIFPKIPMTVLPAPGDPKPTTSSLQSILLQMKNDLLRDLILLNVSAQVADVPCVLPVLTFDSTSTNNDLFIVTVNIKVLIPSSQALSTSKSVRNSMFTEIEQVVNNLFFPQPGSQRNTAQTVTSAFSEFCAICNAKAAAHLKLGSFPRGASSEFMEIIQRHGSMSFIPDLGPMIKCSNPPAAISSSSSRDTTTDTDSSQCRGHSPDSTTDDESDESIDQIRQLI